jgi:hypothetical protein
MAFITTADRERERNRHRFALMVMAVSMFLLGAIITGWAVSARSLPLVVCESTLGPGLDEPDQYGKAFMLPDCHTDDDRKRPVRVAVID